MLHSFFPNPRIFFPSAFVVGFISMIIWYYFGAEIGGAIGLPWAAEDTPPVIGNGFYFTNSFLTFYVYFFGVAVIFLGAWHVMAKHPWSRWSLWGSLFIVFVTWFTVQASVNLNNWARPFFDNLIALLGGDIEPDASLLYQGIWEFLSIAIVYVFIVMFLRFFTSHYVFRWRTAMNDYYVSHWPKLRHIEGASQRIQEDTQKFASLTEGIGSSMLDAVITLVAFLPILAGLSIYVPSLPFIGEVPYALVWLSLFWSIFGTLLLFFVGIKLPGLEFKNQRVEAAYRKELVHGEDDESRADLPTLGDLYTDVRTNYFRLFWHYGYFNLVRTLYLQVDNIFLLIFLIPSVVAMSFTYGIYQQISRAFGQVSSSFQFIFTAWPSVIELLSVRKRLIAFEAAMRGDELPEIDQEYLTNQNKG